MRSGSLFIPSILLLGLFSFPSMVSGNSVLSFPAPKVFEGLKAIEVAPVTLKNMESIKLIPQALRTSIRDQLGKAGIVVVGENTSQNSTFSAEKSLGKNGILATIIRRWETAGPLGSTLNSFTISLQFFQRARVQPTLRESWVVTWHETKSVMVGLKRPKGLELATEELVGKFIQDFKQ